MRKILPPTPRRAAAADVFGPAARRLVDQNWPARRRRHNDVGARLYVIFSDLFLAIVIIVVKNRIIKLEILQRPSKRNRGSQFKYVVTARCLIKAVLPRPIWKNLGFFSFQVRLLFFVSNSVNLGLFEFIGLALFCDVQHSRVCVPNLLRVYLLLDHIFVSSVPRETVPALKPKTLKT